MAECLNVSTLVSIPKYCQQCLSCFGLRKNGDKVNDSDLQFTYKQRMFTTMFTTIAKEVFQHYKQHGTDVHVCLLLGYIISTLHTLILVFAVQVYTGLSGQVCCHAWLHQSSFHIKINLTTKLDKVNDPKIMDEYKFNVHTDYLLPYVRIALTIHNIRKTGLYTID